MKLTRLDLGAYRSYRGVSLPLDAPRVLIAGLNGSGKTSIREAIRWTLLGHCEGTDARGSGADVLIPSGGAAAGVSVWIDGLGQVTRGFTSMGSDLVVEGFTGTSQIQQAAVLIKLNTTAAYLDAVLKTETFLDLAHAEAKALVLGLLDVRIQVGTKSYTLDELDNQYKRAFEERKVSKRVLSQHIVPAAPTGQMPTVEAIDGQLAKLRAALGNARQAIGATVAQRSSLGAERDRLEAAINAPQPEDLTEHITGLAAKIAEIEAAAVGVEPAKNDPQRLTFLRNLSVAINAHDPAKGCVMDATLPCKTDRKVFQARLDTVNAEMKGMDPRPLAVSNPLTEARERLDGLKRRQAAYDNLLAQRESAVGLLAEVNTKLAALPSTESQDAEIAALDVRIQKGEQLLKDARAHWGAMQAYTAAVTAKQDLQGEVDRLEEWVAQLGPNGARVPALADALGRFEAAVNPYVQPFGWTISFSVEPWGVHANGRPVETYSRSERYRIGIALQMGIAMLSGLKFAVVDEMDMLDVSNRSAVTKMLLSAPLDQIIILGTREPGQALPKIAGVLAHRLTTTEAGSVVAESVA